MKSRDMVNFGSNQRSDLGEMVAMQRNGRSDLRRSFDNLLFGSNSAERLRILQPFTVTATSPETDSVDVASGVGIGAERLEDSEIERGVLFGSDTETSRSVSLAAFGAGTVNIYVRFSFDAGEPGMRVFYDPATDTEAADSVYTRLVHDWDAVAATASPGDEWQIVATIAWSGATVATADITQAPHMFFEGDANASFVQEWGDGTNDRDLDRESYGITNLWRWVQAVRRQLADIVGLSATGWYRAVPISLQTLFGQVTGVNTIGPLKVSQLINLGSTILYTDPFVGGPYTKALGKLIISPFDLGAARSVETGSASAAVEIDSGGSGEIAFNLGGGGASTGTTIMVPLHFPPGTTRIKNETWYFECGAAVNRFYSDFYEVNKTTGVFTLLDTSTFAPGLTGAQTGVNTFPTDVDGVIDMVTNYYVLVVRLEAAGGVNDYRIFSGEIEYERGLLHNDQSC